MIASLGRDPRIPFPAEIAVSAHDGVVGFSQRRAAAEDANKIDGVYEVINHLKVDVPAPTAARTTRSGAPRCSH